MAEKTLSVKLSLNDKQFQSSLKKATRSLKRFGASMKRTGQTMTRSLTLPIIGLGAVAIKAFGEQAKAVAQVEAGLISTGNAAGFTSEELQKMAADLQTKTIFGDEEILKDATAQLLTFTNIAGEQFERTQLAALNLSTRLDGDLKSASIQLGKALNDPVANLSALSRSGIQFSKEQKAVIKELAETNRLAEAQKIILDELEKQYGGAAEAAANAGLGPLKQIQNNISDISEEIGKKLLPIIEKIAKKLQVFFNAFSNLDSKTQETILGITLLVATLGPFLIIIGTAIGVIAKLAIVVAGLSAKFLLIVGSVIAIGVAFAYISDNFEAFKERFTDLSYWKNTLIKMIQLLAEYNVFSLIIKGFNEVLEFLGKEKITNPFESIADGLEDLKDETKDYEHEFKSFGDSMKNTVKKVLPFLDDFNKKIGLGSGGGGEKDSGLAKIPTLSERNGPTLPTTLEKVEMPEDLENNVVSLMDVVMELDLAFEKMGETLGSVLMSGAEDFETFGEHVKSSVKSAIGAFLAEGVAAAVSTALKNPAIALNPALIPVIAGLAGGLAKTAFNSLIPAFADGGLVTGATVGMVGEGPGTSMSNPEVIAPLDKLKSMIGESGGGNVQVFGTIKGSDILLSSDRAKNNRNRTRGY